MKSGFYSRTVFFLLLILLQTYTAYALPGKAHAVLSSSADTAKIGELLNITVEVSAPKGSAITLTNDIPFADFEVLNQKQPVSREENEKLTTIYQFEIMAFSLGDKEIGPVKAAYTDPNSSRTETVVSNSIKIKIKSVLTSADSDIKDIKENIPLKLPTYVYLLAVLILAAVIYLIVKLTKYLLSRKNNVAQIVKTPEETAEGRLAELDGASLPEKGLIKEYYSTLSEILRDYIQARHEIPAPDLTTAELCRCLKNVDFPQQSVHSIRSLLQQCDLVKFAKFIPEKENYSKDFDETVKIYQSIRPAKEETGEEGNNE